MATITMHTSIPKISSEIVRGIAKRIHITDGIDINIVCKKN